MDLFAVQGTLKRLLQYHSLKASTLQHSALCTVQLSHPYMTTGKTIALTRWTLVGKVMSLLLNMLSRLVTTFLPRSKRLLISWLQSPSAVILEPPKIKSDTVSTVSPSKEQLKLVVFLQEYWSRLPFPTPGDLLNPEIKPTSLASSALVGRFFTTAAPGKPLFELTSQKFKNSFK